MTDYIDGRWYYVRIEAWKEFFSQPMPYSKFQGKFGRYRASVVLEAILIPTPEELKAQKVTP